ncbi:hypothetical protein LPTSP4_29030 [Leptospira ryugenii]|uniref:TRL-like family protein n=1 Tax=Leptospira ryugenii TaxID=1917863 RepID=A0A2P2E3B2_9LEPT|nr:TRL-like family protein [Leptospira ryugenii]GBF51367.1 hypothetical protein LPTSP4_29030 [Leptospira ryugenii]
MLKQLPFALFIFFLNCASNLHGPQGLLYTNQRMSLQAESQDSPKEGKSCTFSYLGILALGDASIGRAKLDGNIDKVYGIDQSTVQFLGLYAKVCTIVKGN